MQIKMSIRSSDALRNMMKSADRDNTTNNNNNDTASLATMTPYTTDEIDETPCPTTEPTTTITSSALQEESQDEKIIPETASVRQPSRERRTKGRRCFGSVERQLVKQLLASEIEACNVTFTTIKLACARRPDILNKLITLTGFTDKELLSKMRDSARAIYRRSQD